MFLKYWYLVTISKSNGLAFVVQAETSDIARRKVVVRGQKHREEKLTWSRLKQLTGCMIPMNQYLKDLANGPVSFLKDGQITTLVM